MEWKWKWVDRIFDPLCDLELCMRWWLLSCGDVRNMESVSTIAFWLLHGLLLWHECFSGVGVWEHMLSVFTFLYCADWVIDNHKATLSQNWCIHLMDIYRLNHCGLFTPYGSIDLKSSLVHIMAFHLFSTKPSPEPRLIDCHFLRNKLAIKLVI